MISCKVSDYLTISAMPGEVECSRRDLVEQAFRALYLDDWLDPKKDLFQFKCASQYYEFIYRFGDISLKVAYAHNFKKQGICLEFSGKGLDYYREFLATRFVGIDLRKACARFLALSKFGFKTNCSRFDVAFDEILKKGEESERCLDLDTLQSCLLGGAFVSRFRKADPEQLSGTVKSAPVSVSGEVVSEVIGGADGDMPYRVIQSLDLSSGRIGKTVELGKRKSSTFVRFYDKLAEQEAHKFAVDPAVSSWIRFEIEFKKHNAASVFFAFATAKDDNAFVEHMRGVALHLLRFVEFTASRKYNCKTAEWWDKFLHRVKGCKLAYNRPTYNKYVRSVESQKRQNAASLAALIMCRPQTLVDLIKLGYRKQSKTSKAITADFKAIQNLSPKEFGQVYAENTQPLTGLEFWKQFCDASSFSDEFFEKWLDNFVEELVNKVVEGINDDNT